MKKFLALMLAALMLVGVLAACGGSNDKGSASGDGLEGKWSASLDMTDMLNEQMTAAGLGEFIQFDDFGLVLAMELKSDSTYTLKVDKDALAGSLDSVKGQMKDGMTKYFAELMPGVDVDDALAQMGMNMDDLLDQSLDLDTMAGSLDLAGQYKYEDGKLYMSNDVSEAPSDNYLTCTLDGNTLALDAGSSAPDASLAAMLPFVFQRVG